MVFFNRGYYRHSDRPARPPGRALNYWKVLKSRMVKEGNETVTNCNRLKMEAEDGKMRLTDAADTEQLFRLIQSIACSRRKGRAGMTGGKSPSLFAPALPGGCKRNVLRLDVCCINGN